MLAALRLVENATFLLRPNYATKVSSLNANQVCGLAPVVGAPLLPYSVACSAREQVPNAKTLSISALDAFVDSSNINTDDEITTRTHTNSPDKEAKLVLLVVCRQPWHNFCPNCQSLPLALATVRRQDVAMRSQRDSQVNRCQAASSLQWAKQLKLKLLLVLLLLLLQPMA